MMQDARCVGSVPGSKNTRNSVPILSPSYLAGKGLEQGEQVQDSNMVVDLPNYTSDYQRMTDLEILLDGYLLASRYTYIGGGYANFDILLLNYSSPYTDDDICFVNESGYFSSRDREDMLRTVLHLNYSVQIDSGDGTEDSPFVLM